MTMTWQPAAVLTRLLIATVLVCLTPMAAQAAGADDEEERLFTFKDRRITESSGLALSPGHEGVYYTHNDSSAAPEFFAVGEDGRTRARFTVRGAQARDWEAMAASTDPETGRGVLWFADIGDNLDGAWPDVSVYRVMEPAVLKDAVVPATRFRFRYEDGGRNAEGIMVNPRTGRLYVVSKEFSGGVYAAPRRLRADRPNVLRRVASAPLMATDAAYAPDGNSYVVRTYFSATIFDTEGERITQVSMPQLEQAESIAFTRDGKGLLTGTEGPSSPVYRVPVPERALPEPSASAPAPVETQPAQAAAEAPVQRASLSIGGVLTWVAAAMGAIGVIVFLARRTR
ncbi:hypothetical protein HNR30_006659 [Nonomuraea soli]|uniref:Esterase-like activity of phytase family protein n=2 Tax=Nonomuraea soli TaxID=1032476 RepID=A0A7W0CQ46_9ACTN|nr:hypothetical protein [Nonomuraea soli]